MMGADSSLALTSRDWSGVWMGTYSSFSRASISDMETFLGGGPTGAAGPEPADGTGVDPDAGASSFWMPAGSVRIRVGASLRCRTRLTASWTSQLKGLLSRKEVPGPSFTMGRIELVLQKVVGSTPSLTALASTCSRNGRARNWAIDSAITRSVTWSCKAWV